MSLCGLIAYFGYGYWGKLIGLTQAQRGGVFLAFAARRDGYSRDCSTGTTPISCALLDYLWNTAARAGVALPLTRPEYVASLIGSLVFLAVGALAFVMRHYVQAALAEEAPVLAINFDDLGALVRGLEQFGVLRALQNEPGIDYRIAFSGRSP